MQDRSDSFQLASFLFIVFILLTFVFKAAIFDGLTLSSINSFINPTGFYSELYEATKHYPENHLMAGDNERVWNPTRKLLHRELRKGNMPFWNPYVTNGMPFVAEEQTQAANPFYSFLAFVFNPDQSVVVFVFLSFLFSGLGMYLLARELSIGWYGAAVAGISYMFSGPLIVWYMRPNSQISVYLPFLFLALEKGLKTDKKKWPFISGVIIALMLVAGHTQIAVLALLIYEIFLVYRIILDERQQWRQRIQKFLGWNIVSGFTAFCLSAFKLFPFLELAVQSPVMETGRAGLLPLTWNTFIQRCLIGDLIQQPIQEIANIIKLLLPFYFGSPTYNQHFSFENFYYNPFGGNFAETASYYGIVALFLSCTVLCRYLKISRHLRFYALVFCFTVMICFNFPVFGSVRALPLFNLINLDRLFLALTFCGALLAGSSVDYFCSLRYRKRNLLLFTALIALVAFMIGYAVLNPDYSPLRRRYYYYLIPIALLLITLIGSCILPFFAKSKRWLPGLFVVVISLDSLHFAHNFMVFQPGESVLPITPRSRFLSSFANPIFRMKYVGHFHSSFNLAFTGLMMDSTFSVLQIGAHNEFLQAIGERWKAMVPNHKGTVYVLESRWLDLNSVSFLGFDQNYSQEMDALNNDPRFKLLYMDNDLAFWQNETVLPRFHVYSNYVLEEDVGKMVDLLETPTFEYRNTIFVSPETKPQHKYTDKDLAQATVIVRKADFDEVVLDVEVDKPAILGISDSWYPGWRAEVDGKARPILKVNYAFRGIEVDKNSKRVRMFYRPISLLAGFWVTIIFILFTTLSFIIGYKKKKVYIF